MCPSATVDNEALEAPPSTPNFATLKPFWQCAEMAMYTTQPNQTWLVVTHQYYANNAQSFEKLFLGWEKEDPALRFDWREHDGKHLLWCCFTPLALSGFLHNKGLINDREFAAISGLSASPVVSTYFGPRKDGRD